jgi:hypothetical protein
VDHGETATALAKIQGGVDLIAERLLHSNQINDERHTAVNKRLDNHEGRIGGLERDKSVREGERKGLTVGGKIIWSTLGLLIGSGGVAALLELIK